jgi:hypothetical protein
VNRFLMLSREKRNASPIGNLIEPILTAAAACVFAVFWGLGSAAALGAFGFGLNVFSLGYTFHSNLCPFKDFP